MKAFHTQHSKTLPEKFDVFDNFYIEINTVESAYGQSKSNLQFAKTSYFDRFCRQAIRFGRYDQNEPNRNTSQFVHFVEIFQFSQ